MSGATPQHVLRSVNGPTFCGAPSAGAITPPNLSAAEPDEVCPVCLGQLLEMHSGAPKRWQGAVFVEGTSQVLTDQFAHRFQAVAYTLFARRLLREDGKDGKAVVARL